MRNAFIATLLAVSLAAFATPAEDHARGLLAFQRGDIIGAMSALRPAAKAGHAPSQALLGFILDKADFVDESVALYRASAAQNDPEGLAGMASALLIGRGVAKDEKSAFEHFSKAAELGQPASVAFMEQAYRRGLYGVAPDAARADAWAARRAKLAAPAPAASSPPR